MYVITKKAASALLNEHYQVWLDASYAYGIFFDTGVVMCFKKLTTHAVKMARLELHNSCRNSAIIVRYNENNTIYELRV